MRCLVLNAALNIACVSARFTRKWACESDGRSNVKNSNRLIELFLSGFDMYRAIHEITGWIYQAEQTARF